MIEHKRESTVTEDLAPVADSAVTATHRAWMTYQIHDLGFCGLVLHDLVESTHG